MIDAAEAIRIRTATPDDAELVRTMAREIAAHQGSADDVAADADAWRRMLTPAIPLRASKVRTLSRTSDRRSTFSGGRRAGLPRSG